MPFTPVRKFKLEALNRDERFLSLSRDLRLFLLQLLMYVDQLGREIASSSTLRETFFEFDEDVTVGRVDEWLLALEERDWLVLYTSGRRIFMQVNPVVWAGFVSCDGRDGSRYPEPEPGPVSAQSTTWGDLRAASGATPARGEGEVGDWWERPDGVPPAGCPRHPHNTGLIPCGACAGARKIHEKFIRGEMSRDEAVLAWKPAETGDHDDLPF
jgi:hypothetical protein